MSFPTVTEIRSRPEAVTRDTFIDDLSRGAPTSVAASTAARRVLRDPLPTPPSTNCRQT
jgi:hypothetical protein